MPTEQPRQQVFEMVVPAVAQAASETTSLFVAPFAGEIKSASYIPDTAITGANTDTRKISIINKGQAGDGTTEAAALQFNLTVDGVAFDEKALALSGTATNLDIAAGDVIAFLSAKVGNGIADPGGTVRVVISND